MTTLGIFALVAILVIFIIALMATKETKQSKVTAEKFDVQTLPQSSVKLSRRDKVSGKLFKRKIIPLHPEKNRLRKEAQWMRQFNYHQQGLHEYNGRLYWMTHELAVKNGCR